MKKTKKHTVHFSLFITEIGSDFDFKCKIKHLPRVGDAFAWDYFINKILSNYFKNPYKEDNNYILNCLALSYILDILEAKKIVNNLIPNDISKIEKLVFELSSRSRENMYISSWVIVEQVLFKDNEIIVILKEEKE